jgi:Uma2 family endonuclease
MSTSLPRTEPRVVLHDVSWATFRALSREARGGRLVYDRGRLEIMVPSFEHENVKGLIGRLVEVYAEELDIDIASGGSTTSSVDQVSPGPCPVRSGTNWLRMLGLWLTGSERHGQSRPS